MPVCAAVSTTDFLATKNQELEKFATEAAEKEKELGAKWEDERSRANMLHVKRTKEQHVGRIGIEE